MKNGTALPQVGQSGFENRSLAGFDVDIVQLHPTLGIAIIELGQDPFNAPGDNAPVPEDLERTAAAGAVLGLRRQGLLVPLPRCSTESVSAA